MLMKSFIEEFKEFALRGNMMDMAVGVIIGGGFTGIVTSLTDNFINPILNLVTRAEMYTFRDLARFCLLYTSGLCVLLCRFRWEHQNALRSSTLSTYWAACS